MLFCSELWIFKGISLDLSKNPQLTAAQQGDEGRGKRVNYSG
jgi:hypothetical protein